MKIALIILALALAGCSTLDRADDPIDRAIGEFIAGEISSR